MRHEEKKVAKIIQELTMYFFSVGADDMQSSIQKTNTEVIITFKANYYPDYEDTLQNLDEFLNETKIEGIEDIYWELAGSGDPGETSQLLLVGMMIRKAEIQLEDGYVYLKLYKDMEN